MKKITGIYAAMLTSFNSTGDIDPQKTKTLLDLLIASGIDGVFPVSSVGEGIMDMIQ